MMETGLVSIIIPIYNSQKYLEECITSVLRQTYSHLEILCIDDGSTDDSYRIICKLQKEDDRIVLIHQQNAGVSSARNVGMRKAKGEWLVFVDADDMLSEHAVDFLVMCAQQQQADLVIPKFVRNSSKLDTGNNNFISVKQTNLQLILLDYLQYNNQLPEQFRFPHEWALAYSWGRLIHRSLTEKVAYNENLILGEDVLFNYDILSISCETLLLDNAVYFYRSNEYSVTTRFQSQRLLNTKILAQELCERTKKESKKFQQAGWQFVLGRVFHCYTAYFDCLDKKQSRTEQKELLSDPWINESVRKGKINYCITSPSRRAKLQIAYIKLLALHWGKVKIPFRDRVK